MSRSPKTNGSGAKAPLLAPELMARVRQIQIRTHRLVSSALQGAYKSNFRGSGLGIEVDGPNGGFAISGHSTSLVHRSVSAINPRYFARFGAPAVS